MAGIPRGENRPNPGIPKNPGPVATGRLTALSANLLNPFARLTRPDRRALLGRLEAFARLVEAERADLLLCQEVGRSADFRVDTWLAERLGMYCLYLRANGDVKRHGREEGLAIFSRYPMARPVDCLLAGGLWRRPALGAVVQSPLGEIAAYTAHLSLRPWRNRRQPARLWVWVEATAGEMPAVIGGDFNARETAPGMRLLRAVWVDAYRSLNPAAEGATHEAALFGRGIGRLGRLRLDYLFLRPGRPNIRVVSSSHLDSGGVAFSDHLAVLARFEPVA